MNKSTIGIGFGVLLLILVIVGGFFLLGGGEDITEPVEEVETEELSIGGGVVFVEGVVEYRGADGVSVSAESGTSVAQGDSVEVLGEGRAIINLDDGSVLRLGDDTVITLASLDPNHMAISLDKGEVYSRVEAADRVYEVTVDDTRYQAMGTAYLTKNHDEKGCEVYESSVTVKADDESELTIAQGEKYYGELEEITKEDLSEDSFTQWNKEKDYEEYPTKLGHFEFLDNVEEEEVEEKEVVVKKETTPVVVNTGAISLSANGTTVYWNATGSSKGYKVTWSKNSGPTYPTRSGDSYKYLSDPDASSKTLTAFDGAGTYYVRVCEYTGGGCENYSNQVTIVFEEEKKTEEVSVNSISLWSTGGENIAWSVDGDASKGFKVTYSKNSGATYPARSGDKAVYYSSPSDASASLSAFDGEGTYKVRVCAYIGGGCSVYSNEISVEL